MVFLKELKAVLTADDFSINDHLILIISGKNDMEYSTRYTLADLDYDVNDVVDCLKELSIQEYSESLLDIDDDQPPILFVFGKFINGRLVYIKLKIKKNIKKRVLCLSFHYAKYDMKFPYAK